MSKAALPDASVHIVYQDSRRLLAALRVAGRPLRIAVLHGLSGDYAAEAVAEWWSETRALCHQHSRAGVPWVVLADANARAALIRNEPKMPRPT